MVPHKIIGTPVESEIKLVCRIEASPKPITVWSRKKGLFLQPNVVDSFLFKILIIKCCLNFMHFEFQLECWFQV